MAVIPGIMWSSPLSVWHGEKLDPIGLMNLLAEMGLCTIDIFMRHVDTWGVDALRAALGASGLRCSCFYIKGDLLATGEELEKVDEDFTRGIEAAKALGAPLIFTHGTQHTREGESALKAYIGALRERNAQVRDAGRILVIENAGLLARTPEHLLTIVDALGDEGLSLCPDVGNFSIWEIDEVKAVRRLLPWTAHVHLKDLSPEWVGNKKARGASAVLGRGVTPIAEIVELLQAQAWEGAAVWEPGPQDEQGITDGVNELLRLACRGV
ncbi:MAG: sugar phosphate isomerase/epimerase family protein [Armatimonadota bacterium]